MNSHDVTITGYVVIVLAAAGLQFAATRTKAPIPPLGTVFSRIMRSRTGRVGMLVAWAWLGLHFFAK
jgi:Family of unknown function (DUF6186)